MSSACRDVESWPSSVEAAESGDKKSRWVVTYLLHGPQVVYVGYCATWSEAVDRLAYGLAIGGSDVTVEVAS